MLMWTQALPLRAHLSLTNWYIPIKIANATQLAERLVAYTSKTDRHENFISATIKTKKCYKTIEFRFEVIVLVSLSFYLHCRFRFSFR